MKSSFRLSNILANNAGAASAAACHMLQQHVLRRKVNHNIYKLYQCYSSPSRALPHAEQLHMAHESAACAQVCVCVCVRVGKLLWKLFCEKKRKTGKMARKHKTKLKWSQFEIKRVCEYKVNNDILCLLYGCYGNDKVELQWYRYIFVPTFFKFRKTVHFIKFLW